MGFNQFSVAWSNQLDMVCRVNFIPMRSNSCSSRYSGEYITYFWVAIWAMADGDAKLPGSTEGSLDAHSTTVSPVSCSQFLQA